MWENAYAGNFFVFFHGWVGVHVSPFPRVTSFTAHQSHLWNIHFFSAGQSNVLFIRFPEVLHAFVWTVPHQLIKVHSQCSPKLRPRLRSLKWIQGETIDIGYKLLDIRVQDRSHYPYRSQSTVWMDQKNSSNYFAGRQFDPDGNLFNWWERKALDNFKTKTQCIKDQYSEFVVEGLHVRAHSHLRIIRRELFRELFTK